MTIHRLTAGAGYRYLTRNTACADHTRSAELSLTAYYTATGTPPGRWFGRGLSHLAGGHGVDPGTVVTEPAMAALFASGRDPMTGEPLGRPYPSFRTVAERVSTRVARLPASLTREQRATLTKQIEGEEAARGVRHPVSGFDLTFTVPKSVSVLWALAEPAVQTEIAAAHHAAVADTLTFLEDRALFTRIGARSCAQVDTAGAIAAGFDHVDTRTGDPNLHTHLVVANKVQGPDGAWRTLDSRALFTAAVALSETYDSLVADHLTRRLGVGWEWRDRGPRRSPAHEITGVPDPLLTVFSTRSTAITTAVTQLVAAHTATTGRPPTRREVLKMRQQATLATRPDKTPRRLTEQLASWRARAAAALPHRNPALIVNTALRATTADTDASVASPLSTSTPLDEARIAELAGDVLAGLIQRRSTWTRWNALAETARVTRSLRCATTTERLCLHERIVATALGVCVPVDAPEPYTVPEQYRRADGASVFTRAGVDRYTHPLVLVAEHRLETAHADTTAAAIPLDVVDRVLQSESSEEPGRVPPLASDQAEAVRAAATSQRRLEVLVGPAGSGKTTTLLALRRVWEAHHGARLVLGLAPSATAARELSQALGIGCENTAKWLYETQRPQDPYGRTSRWRMRPGQLVIVDEASMASTASLDALTQQAVAAGAKLLLVGDHCQLGAVDAGGAFGLLAQYGRPLQLQSLWRFRYSWEARATRMLRAGSPDALTLYEAHSRLHGGPYEAMVEAAYQAWATDTRLGIPSVLLASDSATVAVLNDRARAERVQRGSVDPQGIQTLSQVTIAVGDRVLTRRNDRRIPLDRCGNEYVRNGMLWDVTGIQPDGSIEVHSLTREGATVRLPSTYVRGHVDLGYAITVHRAQGVTVETTHLVAGPGITREALYVGMTRGRTANHAYTSTDTPPPNGVLPEPEKGICAHDVLAAVLATSGGEVSATAAIREARDDAVSIARLQPVAATLAADIARRRMTRLLAASDLDPAFPRHLGPSPVAGPLRVALGQAERPDHDSADMLNRVASERLSAGDPDLGTRHMHTQITARLNERGPMAEGDLPPEVLSSADVTVADDPAQMTLAQVEELIGQRLAELRSPRSPLPSQDDSVRGRIRRATPPCSEAPTQRIGGPTP